MIGRVESVWRYPVKSMRGESVESVFVGYSGLIGDRFYAVHSVQRATRFPWYTARNNADLIRYQARYRDPAATLHPKNPEASHPNFPDDARFAVDVETPDGIIQPLDDPMLVAGLPARDGETLTLEYSPRNFVDVTPVSLVSHQTIDQLSTEVGETLDPQRFRMNFYVNWAEDIAGHEDTLIGKHLRIGNHVEIAITERDARCKMITLDPKTGDAMPELLKHVLAEHDGCVGVYGSVVREGIVQPGDTVEVVS